MIEINNLISESESKLISRIIVSECAYYLKWDLGSHPAANHPAALLHL